MGAEKSRGDPEAKHPLHTSVRATKYAPGFIPADLALPAETISKHYRHTPSYVVWFITAFLKHLLILTSLLFVYYTLYKFNSDSIQI
ncbi:hypothetical protein ACN38_g10767, partial [Penicillium nordicum]